MSQSVLHSVNVGEPMHYHQQPTLFGDRTQMEQYIKSLIEKAGKSDKPDDAMKFSQAALNAANAMCSLVTSKNLEVK
jgi:hypothetical protein